MDMIEDFEICSKFIMRTPINSFSVYENNLLNNREFLGIDNTLKENILISSENLYKCLKSSKNYTANEKESLVKYYIRSSTRTTPFGLLSGVAFGDLTNYDKKIIINDKIKRNIRPDMEWLHKVIIKLEDEIGDYLKVVWNNTISKLGTKYINNWTSNFFLIRNNDSLGKNRVLINNTNAVNLIHKNTKKFISINELKEILAQGYPDVNEKILIEFIYNLIQKEFLTSNLRFALINNNHMERLIEILKDDYLSNVPNISNLLNELIKIKKIMSEYKNENNKLVVLETLINYMEKIFKSEKYIHVDMVQEYSNISLVKEDIDKDLKSLLNLMIKCSILDSSNKKIEIFKNKFINKFGNREVPLLEVIDEVKGIGMPLINNNGNNISEDFYKLIIEKCLTLKKNEFSLDDDLIKNISNINKSDGKLPDELEIALFPIKNKNEGYSYILSPLIGSNKIGKSIGRFFYLFNDSDKNVIKSFSNKFNDKIEVEISCIPKSGTIANVMNCESFCEYKLQYGSCDKENNNIELNDICIGIHSGELYCKSMKLNKQLVFNINSMVNLTFLPDVFNLLLDISKLNKLNLFNLFIKLKQITKEINHFPRITYKNFILFPEQWHINESNINIKEFNSEFKEYINKFNIPRFVFMQELDKRLLLDLENDLHLDILLKTYKKNKCLELIENNFNYENLIVSDINKNKYLGEAIFFLKRNSNKNIELTDSIEKRFLKNDYNKNLNPLNDWLYLNLKTYEDLEEDLIVNYIMNFYLNQKHYLDKMFFIRYKEDSHEIRLRLKPINQKYMIDLINESKIFCENLIHLGIVPKYSIDTYERETERYGGKEIIELAEDLFFKDSLCVMNLLNLTLFNTIDIDRYQCAIISLSILLNNFGLTLEEQLHLLDKRVKQNDYKDLFRPMRKKMLKLLDSNNSYQNLREIKNGDLLLQAMNLREESAKEYWNKVKECENNKTLSNDKENIIYSIIHMHCNRFLGIDRIDENKIIALLRHSIYSFILYKSRLNKYEKF